MSAEVVGGWAVWRFTKKVYRSLASITKRLGAVERRTTRLGKVVGHLHERVDTLEKKVANQKSTIHSERVKKGFLNKKLKDLEDKHPLH